MDNTADEANSKKVTKVGEQPADFLDSLREEIEKIEGEIEKFKKRKGIIEGEKFGERLARLTRKLPKEDQEEYQEMMKDLIHRARIMFLGVDYKHAKEAVNILRKMEGEFSERLGEVAKVKKEFLEKAKKLFEERRAEWNAYMNELGDFSGELTKSLDEDIEVAKKKLEKKEQKLGETISREEYQSLKKELEIIAKKSYYFGGAEEELRCQKRTENLLDKLEKI